MSAKRYGSLLLLILSLAGLPAMAAQTCNSNIPAAAPNSRYVDPGQGMALCWGANDYGQLGDGTTTESHSVVQVSGILNDMTLGGGNSHSCALLLDGTVQCWGFNANGQLGNGSTSDSLNPVVVSGLSNVDAVAVGAEHNCALLSNGTVQCWGLNSDGQLGNAGTVDSSVPVTVNGIPSAASPTTVATAVAAGDAHSCALLSDGTVWCWGLNDNGQLGNGNITKALAPVQVCGIGTYPIASAVCTSGPRATAIAAGGSHTCARLEDSSVRCWGANSSGQLGNGTNNEYHIPVTVSLPSSSALGVAAGGKHSCALLQDNTVWCWGLNANGQLGNGSTTTSNKPVMVSGISTAMELALGGNHSCARLADGKVQCWGLNANGQLGNGNTSTSATPVTVGGILDAAAIAAGDRHSCAREAIDTGTLVDTATGLMWKRCSEGQTWDIVNESCVGTALKVSWQGALQRVQDVNLGKMGEQLKHNDWRLPNRNELQSLLEHQCTSPAINATLFPGTAAAPYWSSSPAAGAADQAWSVDFNDGRVSGAAKTDNNYARLVRGGQ